MEKEKNLIKFDDNNKKIIIGEKLYLYNELRRVKDFSKKKTHIVDDEIKKAIINLFAGDSYNSDFPPHTQKEETIVSQLGIEIFFKNSSIKINLLENEKEEILINTAEFYSYKNLLNFYINKINKIIKNNDE